MFDLEEKKKKENVENHCWFWEEGWSRVEENAEKEMAEEDLRL